MRRTACTARDEPPGAESPPGTRWAPGGARCLLLRVAERAVGCRTPGAAAEVHGLRPRRHEILDELLLRIIRGMDLGQGAQLRLGSEDQVRRRPGPLHLAGPAVATLEDVVAVRTSLPLDTHVEQVAEEVDRQRTRRRSEDAVLAVAVVCTVAPSATSSRADWAMGADAGASPPTPAHPDRSARTMLSGAVRVGAKEWAMASGQTREDPQGLRPQDAGTLPLRSSPTTRRRMVPHRTTARPMRLPSTAPRPRTFAPIPAHRHQQGTET